MCTKTKTQKHKKGMFSAPFSKPSRKRKACGGAPKPVTRSEEIFSACNRIVSTFGQPSDLADAEYYQPLPPTPCIQRKKPTQDIWKANGF